MKTIMTSISTTAKKPNFPSIIAKFNGASIIRILNGGTHAKIQLTQKCYDEMQKELGKEFMFTEPADGEHSRVSLFTPEFLK